MWFTLLLLAAVGTGCSAYHRARLWYLVRHPHMAVDSRYFLPAMVMVMVVVLAGIAAVWFLSRGRSNKS